MPFVPSTLSRRAVVLGPMTEEEMQEAPGRILHLPTVLGANVPAYNIEGVKAESIGYVELSYAIQNKIDYGSVQNLEGEFVRASTATVTAAAESAVKNMPRDFRVSITNAPGTGVYPVSSFTWLLLYQSPRDRRQSMIMVDFMKWALTEGQKYATDLGYAPLPPEIVKLEMEALATIKGS